MSDSSQHQSRRDTEKSGYDKLRQNGVTPENARKIAREASETVHRNIDKSKR